MPRLPLIAALLALAGCQAAETYRQAGTEAARQAKDSEARILIDSTCAMGIGAWNRLKNPNEQVGSMLMCGGQTNELLQVRAGALQVLPPETDAPEDAP